MPQRPKCNLGREYINKNYIIFSFSFCIVNYTLFFHNLYIWSTKSMAQKSIDKVSVKAFTYFCPYS